MSEHPDKEQGHTDDQWLAQLRSEVSPLGKALRSTDQKETQFEQIDADLERLRFALRRESQELDAPRKSRSAKGYLALAAAIVVIAGAGLLLRAQLAGTGNDSTDASTMRGVRSEILRDANPAAKAQSLAEQFRAAGALVTQTDTAGKSTLSIQLASPLNAASRALLEQYAIGVPDTGLLQIVVVP